LAAATHPEATELVRSHRRRHSTLGYVSPKQVAKTQEAQVGVHGSGSSPVKLLVERGASAAQVTKDLDAHQLA
jgi:hypothetical protein